MYPFNFSLLATAYIPMQSCKRASFSSLIPARTRLEPNIFEARFRPESQIYREGLDMRNCGVTKNVVCRYS